MAQTCSYAFDPTEHGDTTVSEHWQCPHDSVDGADRCPFHMSADERSAYGVSDADLRAALLDELDRGSGRERSFVGATLPGLDLSYLDVESPDQHPVDLRHVTVEGDLSLSFTRFEEALDLRHAEVGGFAADNVTFEHGLFCTGATFDGPVDLFEAEITGENAAFGDVTFCGTASFDETNFQDDVTFDRSTFADEATFLGAQFHGRATSIGDDTSFADATFEAGATFQFATFEYTRFDRCRFAGTANFEGATAEGAITFDDCTFEGRANFDEFECEADAHFQSAVFEDGARFRGARVAGGTAVLADDIDFRGATFGDDVTFERGVFGTADFQDAVFEATADFERTDFEENVDFESARFHGRARFEEVQFHGDSTFRDATFDERVTFGGAAFFGETDYLEDDAIFAGAVFFDDADFRKVQFTAANFEDTQFNGDADFTETTFTDSLHLRVTSFGEQTYFDFTQARVDDGRIVQPKDGWVRFDFTEATLGTVTLGAMTLSDERSLLSYFRFCNTTFDGFDFSDHTAYLDRNDWVLHSFEAEEDHDPAVRMTPAVVEETYLKAKTDASAQSNIKAAGEFRVKRQQHARQKFLNIATDDDEALSTRTRNALRATENTFLGATCGYGLRLYRITVVFVLFPLLAGFLFAFGGDPFATQGGAEQLSSLGELATARGLEQLAMNVYFSYITFLTIGYGNIGPEGMGARFTAAGLVYLNVILAGLFLYSLIKRSEI